MQFWPDDDDGTARIVDALAEQVLPETALLALEHVASDFSGRLLAPVMTRPRRPLSNSASTDFLQHPLFVADDDVRRAELDQALEAVVPVDHATIEIVQIGRGEAAAIQRHQRAQFRRDDRNNIQDHPFGTAPIR